MDKVLKISILSQEESWINPFLEEWINSLSNNFQVNFVHQEISLMSGDILFILSYWQKVSTKTLEKFSSSVVVHASDLPKGRGWSPVSWTVLEGHNQIPIVLFKATSQIDQGEIYLKDYIYLEGHELINEIRVKQAHKTIDLCNRFINEYPEILNHGNHQIGTPSYFPRRTPKDSELDINKSIKEQFNLLRIADNDNYPVFFDYLGKRYIIKIYKEN
ncbi:hypothetical protein L5220_04250 [Synechococcus sp. PCC 6716]|nr:hypothetical protein [Synechococcus sp. PCC 6716]